MNPEESIRQEMEACAQRLTELCDSVQIIVTAQGTSTDQVFSCSTGAGCIYSRQGAVREWLIQQDQYARTHADWQQRNDLND